MCEIKVLRSPGKAETNEVAIPLTNGFTLRLEDGREVYDWPAPKRLGFKPDNNE